MVLGVETGIDNPILPTTYGSSSAPTTLNKTSKKTTIIGYGRGIWALVLWSTAAACEASIR